MMRQRMLPTFADITYFCFPSSVGLYLQEPGHYVDRQRGEQPDFSLHVITEGKGYVVTNDNKITITKGDAFLYFPGERQIYYSSEEEPWEVRWVHFYGARLHDYMLERSLQRSTLWKVSQLQPIIEAHHALLEETLVNRIVRPAKLSTLTYGILAEFISQAAPYHTTSSNNEVLERLIELLPVIQDCANQPFVLEEWAQRLRVSTYYFCKLFRKATQMTPMTFVTLCRMQQAKQLLVEQPDTTVQEIARLSGYANVSYFNKKFLESEHMTPTMFRNSMRV